MSRFLMFEKGMLRSLYRRNVFEFSSISVHSVFEFDNITVQCCILSSSAFRCIVFVLFLQHRFLFSCSENRFSAKQS